MNVQGHVVNLSCQKLRNWRSDGKDHGKFIKADWKSIATVCSESRGSAKSPIKIVLGTGCSSMNARHLMSSPKASSNCDRKCLTQAWSAPKKQTMGGLLSRSTRYRNIHISAYLIAWRRTIQSAEACNALFEAQCDHILYLRKQLFGDPLLV